MDKSSNSGDAAINEFRQFAWNLSSKISTDQRPKNNAPKRVRGATSKPHTAKRATR